MLTKMLRKLHRNQRGTALTEFVITLPIFVLIFSFMGAFHRQTRELNRIRYRAATDMWRANMAVQQAGTSVSTDHGLPFTAAANANSIISGSPSEAGDATQQLIVAGLVTGRSGNEMRAGATVVGMPAPDPASAASLTFASGIAQDGLTPLQPAGGPVAVFNFAVARAIGITRHAGIIGTRYGAVEGKNTGTIETYPWGNTYSFSAQYDVLVSPISIPSNDEMYVVGASRLLAEQDGCLNSVLEISTSSSGC